MKIEGSCYQNIAVLDYQQKQKGLKASLTLAFFGTELVFAICMLFQSLTDQQLLLLQASKLQIWH